MEQLLNDFPFKNEGLLSQQLFRKGDVIYFVNTPSFGFYYISKGTVKIYKTDSNGKEIILRLARKGDFIGHEFILGEKMHLDTAKALEPTICQYMDGQEFQILMMNNPAMAVMILQKMREEINQIQNRCIDLMRKNVRERLAGYFITMSQNHGDITERGIKITIQLSREEIASLIGTANETAIRFISEFKDLGYIEEEERHFYILNEERLLQIAKLISM